ncbi:MAG TPA: alcohol dehydrogenase catalytic domain-containing protein [Bryobacteraceae bacterium]|nr:alcohol dehydrogenase catalytic domain-containing protein [Bryobacteraceae bacterium]
MKVAELYEPMKFRLAEARIADPGAGEIQARVRAVGVCGSDIHYYAEGSVGDTPCVYPMVLGHEPTGEIAKTGPGVTGWSPGDKAILEPAIYCYHCEFCMSGRHNVCENIRFLSMPDTPGFFREYVNLPVANVLPMPPQLGFEENTLFEPLAIVLHSMQFAQPQVGDTAAVFGTGPIGLLTVGVLKIAGVGRVYAVDPVPHRRELALRMGADAVIDPRAVDAVREIRRDSGRRGVDVAIDCVTKDDSVNQCIAATRAAGRVVVTGIPSETRLALEFHILRRNEITLYNVRRSNHETPAALQLLRERPKLFGPLVTHARPLDDIAGAFRVAATYADGVGKMVVTP